MSQNLTPTRLVVLGGSGDAFLVCGLVGAFRSHHGRNDVRVVLTSRLAAVAGLFGVPYEIDDALVLHAQQNPEFQRNHPNEFLADTPYYVHPCFWRSPVSIDEMTTMPDASQADMYRMLLRLPVRTPLELPPIGSRRPAWTSPDTVVVITDSSSWPNTQPGFWEALVRRLDADGWHVHVNEKADSLDTLLERCRNAAWVIGPQCGVMSILVTGEFACRKTLATPNIDGNRRPEYLASETFPYGYVTKFANHDYDVEEFKISDDNHPQIIDAIAAGVNARTLWPHDPTPVITIQAPISPGDFIDRLAVLTVKMQNFTAAKRASIRREHDRFAEIARQMGDRFPTEQFGRLVDLHRSTYELLARMVPTALHDSFDGGSMAHEDHVAAVRFNKTRVKLKAAIDAALHAPYGEVKDYY